MSGLYPQPVIQDQPVLTIGQQEFSDFEGAKAALNHAIEQDNQDSRPLQTLGEVYALKGLAGEAISLYERAAAVRSDPYCRVRLGELYMRAGRLADAERCFDEVTSPAAGNQEISERLAFAYVELADGYFAELELEKALTCHGKSELILPGMVEFHVGAALKDHIHATLANVMPAVPAAAEGGATYHGSVVVWGKDDVEFFLNYGLPSLLASGNLPALAKRERLLLLVHADIESIHAIDAADSFKALQSHAEVLFVEIPQGLLETTRHASFDAETQGRHAQLLEAAQHQIALRLAKEKHAGLFCLAPDWVFSDGALGALYEPLQNGRDFSVVPIFTTDRAAVVPALDGARNDGTVSVSASGLTALAIENMPASWRGFFPQGERFLTEQFPSRMLWRFGESGLVMHTFRWAPALISAAGVAHYRGQHFGRLDHRMLDACLSSDEDWGRVAPCADPQRGLIIAAPRPSAPHAPVRTQSAEWDLDKVIERAQPSRRDLAMSKANMLLLKEPVVYDPAGERDQAAGALAAADHLVGKISAVFDEVSLTRI